MEEFFLEKQKTRYTIKGKNRTVGDNTKHDTSLSSIHNYIAQSGMVWTLITSQGLNMS